MSKFWTLDRVIEVFIFAVAIAAFSHSQWSFSTAFQGVEPVQQNGLSWLSWYIPGALMALALDVGQIATSRAIKIGHRSRAMYTTFLIFSAVTYYLQFYFIVHHAPELELAPGVAQQWRGGSQFLSDASIWFYPAVLPLSTFLYTISYIPAKNTEPDVVIIPRRRANSIENARIFRRKRALSASIVSQVMLTEPDVVIDDLPTDAPGKVVYTCKHCGFTKEYDTPFGAANAQRSHERGCKVLHAGS